MIYTTTDGGNNWKTIEGERGSSNVNANDCDMYAFDKNNLWICSENGTILYSDKLFSSTTSVEKTNVKVEKFDLKANYPNPFNPSTTINYSIPQASNVTLIVYDMLGKEICTLVNNFQNAGNYKVQFDSGNQKLSSGVYIYTLNAGKFSKSMKMVVLK